MNSNFKKDFLLASLESVLEHEGRSAGSEIKEESRQPMNAATIEDLTLKITEEMYVPGYERIHKEAVVRDSRAKTRGP